MMAYGGSGPAHAGSYGADVGAAEVIIPYFATVHSAYGAALSDMRFSLRHSEPIVLPVDPARLEGIYAAMEARGTEALAAADVPRERRVFRRWVEARFRRQVHHVRVEAPARFDESSLAALPATFEREYERLYGRGSALNDAGVELVNYGVEAIGIVDKPPVERAASGAGPVPRTERAAWCPHRRSMVTTPIYDGAFLPAGTELEGPLVIEHPGTTIVALAGQRVRIDEWRHTRLILSAARRVAAPAAT
jgi:N-methylhydantoinase A